MSKNIWELMGTSRHSKSESDIILENIISKIFISFEKILNVDISSYSSLEELIDQKPDIDHDKLYFWNWFIDYGKDQLKLIASTRIDDKDETLDFLDYRDFILESDIKSGITDNVFTSIADTLTMIGNYIETSNQHSVTKAISDILSDQFIINLGETEKYKSLSSSWTLNSNKELNQKNPAEIEQDFCYHEIYGRG